MMYRFRNALRTVMIFSVIVWLVGFFMGNDPEKPLYWEIATYAIWAFAGGAVLLIATLPFGKAKRVDQPRKLRHRASDHYGKGITGVGPMEGVGKCLNCGRPKVPGSNYCRYHTDLRSEAGSGR